MDKTFPAHIEKLYEMLEYISKYADSAGIKKDTIRNIELGLEEVLVNVIVHGYGKDKMGNISIGLGLTTLPGIQITIIDDGIPFNPNDYSQVTSPLSRKDALDAETEVGGWGLFLIFKVMDKVEYARISGKNILKLEKHLN